MEAAPISEHEYNIIHDGNEKYLKVAAIYGANASGKSNVIEAFDFMREYVLRSLDFAGSKDLDAKKEKNANIIKTMPFMFSKEMKNKPSMFEVYFKIEDRTYQYGFLIKGSKIIEEWLYYKTKTRKKFNKLFERSRDKVSCDTLLKDNEMILNSALEDETLVVSLGAKLKIDLIKKIYRWFFLSDVVDYGNSSENLFLSRLLPRDIENENCKKLIKKFLNSFDESIENIEVEKSKGEDNKPIYKVYTFHRSLDSNEMIKLPMIFESSGTQKMFSLFQFFYDAIKDGSVLFIDELNARLHPLLMRNILLLFHNENVNTKNAQLIFTTHDVSILNKEIFRRDEIWFTEKNSDGISKLYSLVDFNTQNGKVRKDASFSKDYLSGKYGAIPELKQFEMVEG